MVVALPFLFISMALAAVAGDLARRNHRIRRLRATRPDADAEIGSPVLSLVRMGRVGKPLAAPMRARIRVAPTAEPTLALEVFDATGNELRHVGLTSLLMVRAWSGGKLVIALGKVRESYGPPWPLGPYLAGWELHLVTAAGESVRCYGSPGTTLDPEFERLQDRLRRLRLMRAS